MPRLLLVSNRLPVTVRVEDGRLDVTPSSGGLATGLRGPHERSGGRWIGWPGDVASLDESQRQELEELLREMKAVPLHLTPDEIRGYYDNFSNGVLWPLFHYLVDRVDLDTWHFDTYQRVNERFAEQVADEYRPGDLIWVHDFHLALVPAMLRTRLPEARIAFFLHTPFPSWEVFRVLPWREEILAGMLGADLIGFHALPYARHFTGSLLACLGIAPDVEQVHYSGRDVQVGAFPMGIDAHRFARLAREPDVSARAQEIRGEGGGRRIILGIDRLDYTKGLPRRLLMIERLLGRDPSLAAHLRVIQVVVPSRTGIDSYDEIRRSVDEIVGRINGAFATPDSVLIHYMFRSLDERELVAMYCAADVMLVTPLRDGMNLVAKEFVATRTDECGVLVLSEFAGAAHELGDALRVNPYDIDQTASTLLRALHMPLREQRARMRALRARVLANDVHAWADRFLGALEGTHSGAPVLDVRGTAPEVVAALAEGLRVCASLLVFLDYDGTLVPLADSPELAAPDPEVRALLVDLAARPGTRVHVVSGRPRQDLELWLGDLPIGLHAEHGFWSRTDPDAEWEPVREQSSDWKLKLLPILEQFVRRTPGARIEEKTMALAWHYRQADAAFGRAQARELRHYLHQVLSNLPVEVMKGEKVVEVRPYGLNKGLAVQRVLAGASDASVLALGDDVTDEEMFAALPSGSFAVHVGPNPSRAPYRLQDVAAARAFLHRLLA